ncbi:hypothetical protein R3P38DRAFT_1355361 [Favolaschia claudopus]|uniref:Transmembrane protein n=1 Tax=Favolaschia claudopus TaxID=2862362 RepID=A0AAW0DR93_9AGAR
MPLEYPLTRNFPGKYFSTAAFAGAIVLLVFLTTINVVLTGYETITVFRSDYNVTQSFWYDKYMPSQVPKAGTLCDSRFFNLGDTFTTNNTLFKYNIDSIVNANAGDSGITYKGETLDHCDVTSIYLNADALQHTIDYTAVIECRTDEYSFSARTDFSLSTLAGKYNRLLGVQRLQKNRQEGGAFNKTRDSRGVVLNALTSLSGIDLGTRIFSLLQSSNGTTPVTVSLQADFPFCPAALGRIAACAVNTPQFNISTSFVAYSSLLSQEYYAGDPITETNTPVITNDTFNVLANALQTTYAAVRIDLGNLSPNNFISNTSVIPATIFSTFPSTFPGVYSTSEEYANLVGDEVNPYFNLTGLLPLEVEGPAHMDVVFLCRFQQRLPPAQAFIAVLVATLSMFSSGWAVFLALATKFAKGRNPEANSCSGHTKETSEADKTPFLD